MVPKRPVTTRLCAGFVRAVRAVLCARLSREGDRRGCGDVLEEGQQILVEVDGLGEPGIGMAHRRLADSEWNAHRRQQRAEGRAQRMEVEHPPARH